MIVWIFSINLKNWFYQGPDKYIVSEANLKLWCEIDIDSTCYDPTSRNGTIGLLPPLEVLKLYLPLSDSLATFRPLSDFFKSHCFLFVLSNWSLVIGDTFSHCNSSNQFLWKTQKHKKILWSQALMCVTGVGNF